MTTLIHTNPQIVALDGKLTAKREELNNLFQTYKNDDGSFKAMPAEVRESIQTLMKTDLPAMQKELDDAKGLYLADSQNREALDNNSRTVTGLPTQQRLSGERRKSLGELVTEGQEYKGLLSKGQMGFGRMDFGVEVPEYDYVQDRNRLTAGYTITGDNGLPVFPQQTSLYVPSAQVVPTIMQYLPIFQMSSDSYTYRQESEFINNVTAVPEADATGLVKSGFKATTKTATAAVIGHYLEVTEQQFNDVPNFTSILNGRAQLMLDLGIEGQVLTGSGSGENLTGLYNTSGKQTYVKGTNTDSNGEAENNADAILHLLTSLRTTGRCNPSLVVMHDTNWLTIQLMKDANGNYIWGRPDATGPKTLWGVPVLTTTNATLNSALSADLPMFVRAGIRSGVTVSLEKINDQAIRLLRSLIMYVRMGLEVYRSTAVGVATSLN